MNVEVQTSRIPRLERAAAVTLKQLELVQEILSAAALTPTEVLTASVLAALASNYHAETLISTRASSK